MKKKSVRVLAYHEINDVENFEKQIRFLKNHYSICSFKELIGGQFFGKAPVLITFDDVDRTVYTNAFPILTKYKIPAIVFIVTGLINSRDPFWWNEVVYYLGSKDGNKKNWELKDLSNLERLSYLEELRLSSNLPRLKYEQLNISELKNMASAGILVANHSHTHPMFDKCTTTELTREITLSMKFLKELGFSAEIFAYPNGNFSPQAEDVLIQKEVKYAFLFDHKINGIDLNPLRISRLSVNDTTPIWKFKLILSGLHTNILPITRLVGKLKSVIKRNAPQ